jgi:putative ABC transport system permease protein
MASLAWRNLVHDKIRMAITLTGVVFSVTLMVVQTGLLVGFATTTSGVIDHAAADLWIALRGVRNFDAGLPFSERRVYQTLATPGVAAAEKYVISFVNWKRPDGGAENVIIVGYDPKTGLGGPWNVVAGDPSDLNGGDGIFIDELYKETLGVSQIGELVEINGHRARIKGFTRGIRSFTTSPYVFTAFKDALNYARMKEDETVYVMVKASPGVDIAKLKRTLAERLTDVDVYTKNEFSVKTRAYWLITTGAGASVGLAALMGFVVGVVVVAQTIYSTTLDHIREFGTLKAMGASNGYIYRVIIKQATISAAIGYGVGMAVGYGVERLTQSGNAVVEIPSSLAIAMFFVTLAMCVGASVISINRVTRIDPAMVFKG